MFLSYPRLKIFGIGFPLAVAPMIETPGAALVIAIPFVRAAGDTLERIDSTEGPSIEPILEKVFLKY